MDNKILTEKIAEKVGDLLKGYKEDIGKAYLKVEDGKALTVGLNVKLKPNPTGPGIKVEAGISLITERVKDVATCIVNSDQKDLPLKHKEERKKK